MLWRLTLNAAAFALIGNAALLPEKFAGYTRSSEPAQIKPEDPELWTEYGLTGAERAEYSGAAGQVAVTAFRLKDPTGAFAAYQWQRAVSPVRHRGNYLIRTDGKLSASDAQELIRQLPQVVQTSLPPLSAYLPTRGRVPNSERYLLGNTSLARFEPRIPAELAALDRGAEAQVAKYRAGGSEVQMTVISYPTPQMAIAYTRKVEGLPGVASRRSGPLLTVIPEGAANAAASKLLSEVNYSPKLTWNEYVSKDTPQDAAKMILAIVALAGGLIVLSLVLGLTFGGSKFLAKRLGWARSDDGFTSLHLEGK